MTIDKIIAAGYFGYLGVCITLGVTGELTGYRGLCQFAVKLAMIFLCTLGVLGVVCVLLALCVGAWFASRRVASVGRALGRWFESTHGGRKAR